MQKPATITFFATVSNPAASRISKNGHPYSAFGIALLSDRDLEPFHYNVVAFGNAGQFAKSLSRGERIVLSVQAYSQPDNNATIPLLTAIFVQPVQPAA